ncbi:MAG: hypothetical protein FI685_04475 [SAR202 cluster bacterium]|mgnify:FL=1|nr:hypothetical protein [Chloroflexota bacterium]MDP6426269.1 hypothetical protein [Dehalococcoidia bacterium]MDP7612750.1 hypothetical protein [Dehalococcoidia bacterium]MQG47328.1 hypothetical protein [SAR202 cluster bacterium]
MIRTGAILLSTLAIIVLLSCGNQGSNQSEGVFEKVSNPDKSLTLEDLKAVGFKKSKTYDVSELTGADSAYFGFWGKDPYDRKDFEVRFYPTGQSAVDDGTIFAEERVGENAVLDKKESSWPEGLKDARQCGGDKASGPASHGIQNCKKAKYWDYFIYGNLILFCPGGNIDTAIEICTELLEVLDNP